MSRKKASLFDAAESFGQALAAARKTEKIRAIRSISAREAPAAHSLPAGAPVGKAASERPLALVPSQDRAALGAGLALASVALGIFAYRVQERATRVVRTA